MLDGDKETKDTRRLAASTMVVGNDEDSSSRDGEDLTASVADLGETVDEELTSSQSGSRHESPQSSPRILAGSVAASALTLLEITSDADGAAQSNNPPNFGASGVLKKEVADHVKPTPANSPWWATYPLTTIMLLASFGAGLNFMLSFMNGRYNNADPAKTSATFLRDANFKVFGDVTNLMILGTSVLAKAGLDFAYNHNPLSSISNSLSTSVTGAALGAFSAFGYKQATNSNLPRAEEFKGFVAEVLQPGLEAIGKANARGRY